MSFAKMSLGKLCTEEIRPKEDLVRCEEEMENKMEHFIIEPLVYILASPTTRGQIEVDMYNFFSV
jgi:hypothetical protein